MRWRAARRPLGSPRVPESLGGADRLAHSVRRHIRALSRHAAALDAESLVVNLEINQTPEELLVRALRARGFGVLGVGDGRAAMSSTTDVGIVRSAFSTHLESLTFRKVLRIVLRERDRGSVSRADLAPTTGAALEAYLDALITDRYLSRTGDPDVWAVTVPDRIRDFGPTLEWLVARALVQPLHWNAAPSVLIRDAPSNDYDVIAEDGGRLLVVECKSGNPANISMAEFATFLARHRFLAPDLSIFLLDDDRSLAPLAGRINGWVGGDLREPWQETTGAPEGFVPSAERGQALYIGPHHLYLTNVKPSIASALEACLRQFQRDRQRPQERRGGPHPAEDASRVEARRAELASELGRLTRRTDFGGRDVAALRVLVAPIEGGPPLPWNERRVDAWVRRVVARFPELRGTESVEPEVIRFRDEWRRQVFGRRDGGVLALSAYAPPGQEMHTLRPILDIRYFARDLLAALTLTLDACAAEGRSGALYVGMVTENVSGWALMFPGSAPASPRRLRVPDHFTSWQQDMVIDQRAMSPGSAVVALLDAFCTQMGYSGHREYLEAWAQAEQA